MAIPKLRCTLCNFSNLMLLQFCDVCIRWWSLCDIHKVRSDQCGFHNCHSACYTSHIQYIFYWAPWVLQSLRLFWFPTQQRVIFYSVDKPPGLNLLGQFVHIPDNYTIIDNFTAYLSPWNHWTKTSIAIPKSISDFHIISKHIHVYIDYVFYL